MRALFPLLALLLLAACASTEEGAGGGPALPPRTVEGTDGLYSMELSHSFRERKAPGEHYDTFFAFPRRDWMVGVIIDAPPQDLESLDISAEGNARASGFPVDLVRVQETALGGLVAHRSEFELEPEPDARLLMLNIHTSTAEQNVQLIIAGPLADAEMLRELAGDLEGGGFAFAAGVEGLKARPPYDLEDPQLPIVFREPLETWAPVRPGTLNEAAFLEMFVPGEDLWFMALREVLSPEQAANVSADPEYFDRVCQLTHDEIAGGLKPVPPGDLEPFHKTGGPGDRRWSLGGLFEESNVAVTYRFRVVQSGPEVVRLYCWGQAGADVKATCDALFDNIKLKSQASLGPTDA
jgi:hypothetical protein